MISTHGVTGMGTTDLLILRRPEIDERFRALAERLAEDAALRELYVNDPARVIANEVFGDAQIPGAEISRGNRLLFGLLTNDGFMRWIASYQENLKRSALAATDMDDPELALRTYLAITDRNKLHEDLVVAVAEYADPELIAALTWGGHAQVSEDDARALLRSGELRFSPDVAVDIETFIYAVAAVIAFGVAVVALLIA